MKRTPDRAADSAPDEPGNQPGERAEDRRPGGDTSGGELRLQDTVRLSADGLAKVLGDLEARVIRVVWELERPAPARVVHERITREHAVAIHTVITVLN